MSPSATLRRNLLEHHDASGKGRQSAKGLKQDRRHWKTLRDFVDDQAIEDALEMIESDRSALDVGP